MDKTPFYAKKHVFKDFLFHFFTINLSCSFRNEDFLYSYFFNTIILNHFNYER